MKLGRQIYFGESVMGRKYELSWKLKHNLPGKGIYMIVLTSPPCANLMEIYPYEASRGRKRLRRKTVIGVAMGKEEAIGLVKRIIDDVYALTGSLDIRGYFLDAGTGEKGGNAVKARER